MDSNTFLIIVALGAIVIIALFSSQITASIGKWFNISSKQLNDNHATIKGNKSKIIQKEGSNEAKIEGDENEITQGH